MKASLAHFCAAWLALAVSCSRAQVAQFGANIFLGGPYDWEPSNGGKSRCEQMIDTVKQYPYVKYVQFVPTWYWWDSGPEQPWPPGFDPSCANSNLSTYYCYDRFNATTVQYWCIQRQDGSPGSCSEVTPDQISSFQTNVGNCMKYAADQGLNIAVNARVDDGRNLGGWRNTLNFSPVEKYGSYSYEDAILNPLADAIASAVDSGTEVQFTPQGEMGATLYFHPNDWQAVMARLRQRITDGRNKAGHPGPVKVGLGANNLKACGCQYIGIVDAYQYLGNLSANLNTNGMDLPAIKQAYLAADFLSISAYIPVPTPQFQVCDLEGLMQRMDTELKLYSISLNELISSGVGIVWGEYGVGGGSSQSNHKATTAEEAAFTPFFGVPGPYSCDIDPFDMCHPTVPNPVRDFRRYYYNQTAAYFDQDGCSYHGIQAAYIWGTGSWDALSIYPGDSDSQGSFSDPEVTAIINSHNQAAASTSGRAGRQTVVASSGTQYSLLHE